MYRLPDDFADAGRPAGARLSAALLLRDRAHQVPARAEPLPAAGDWAGLQLYHKQNYNSALGKTRIGDFLAACQSCGVMA